MRFIKSLYRSFKEAFASNEEVQKIGKRYPRTVSFLGQRLDRNQFTGLYLTILCLAFLYVLALFFGIISDFTAPDIIVKADVRLNTLLYVFRNASMVKIGIWITLLGESPTIIVFALIVSIFLWLSRRKERVLGLWLAIIGSESFTYITKLIFQRPRPLNAVFLENTNSFPSGHATIAVAFYGFLVYLLFRSLKKKKYRLLVVLAGVLLMLAIGFSRLYLGVHYLSDVWAGYLVGLLWLIIAIGITEWKHSKRSNESENLTTKRPKVILVGLVSAAGIFYLSYGFLYQPKFLPKFSTTVDATATSTTLIFSDFNLPRYTETLTGETQEPISFVISAKDDASFVADFEKSGWSLADPVNFNSTVKLTRLAIANKDYATAPMTPSFWNKQVHDFGFEKPTEAKSARQRHHARFWKTNLKTVQGDTVYVGTVSLDIGIKWFVTHRISPDIDTERELLFSDLQKALEITRFEKVKLVNPILGQNFSGDPFFTDGESYFINFDNESPTL